VTRFATRYSTLLWIVAGVALALMLRAPWFHAGLNRDEGGVALVARGWTHAGPYAYGAVFLDRPPLLVALYRLAGDPGGIRALGAVAASLLVVTSTLLAVRIAGRSAAPWAAGITAVLASSFALKSVFTPAELLAAVPASASVLMLVVALERQSRRLWLFAGAGLLAALALLIKQSFADALAAGAVAVLAGKFAGVSWRETFRRAGAYAAGVGVVVVALVAWAALAHRTLGSVYYAMFGFRLAAVHALAGGASLHISRLSSPALDSGILAALLIALVGIARLRGRPVVRVVLATWTLVALVGVLAGGSYWPHYLIALVSVTAAGAAAALVRHRWIAATGVVAMTIAAATVAFPVAIHHSADTYDESAVAVGDYINDRSEPGDTAYVLYAKADILYYSGLPAAFPYNWSLMMRSAPHAEAKLRQDLASPSRPTWLVQWQHTRAFGLDKSGLTERLVTQHYRRVTTLCGHPLFLARGAHARAAPVELNSCGVPSAPQNVS
jgi:hypothetical protein